MEPIEKEIERSIEIEIDYWTEMKHATDLGSSVEPEQLDFDDE